jgi:hypothetical protein
VERAVELLELLAPALLAAALVDHEVPEDAAADEAASEDHGRDDLQDRLVLGCQKHRRKKYAVTPIYRAPMRARDREVARGAGARFGLRRGLVGTGDALPRVPADLADAIAAATSVHGEKAGRMLSRFAEIEDGAFVWTQDEDGWYWLGVIAGSWRYDDSADAKRVGIHHVRPVTWASDPVSEADAPAGVVATFARGGRNFQRIHDADAERRTSALWERLAR